MNGECALAVGVLEVYDAFIDRTVLLRSEFPLDDTHCDRLFVELWNVLYDWSSWMLYG